MTILPPGVNKTQFAAAMDKYRAALGADWVFTSDEDLVPYRDPFSFIKDQPNELIPSAAVAPDSVEQVQAVVKIANEYKIPLYAISTGKNYAYGGASPNVRGAVTVDLKRMNRVLEIDEHRNFAMVEPGVNYMDLYRAIQERGLKLMIDTPDPGWGSPMGNALDHGIGYTAGPYRDHFGAHCGMEVVLGTGEVMRTGMGAMPAAKTWNDYKYGYGPDPSGLFGQGNYGIVTKMGFHLMPQPEHWRSGLITVRKRADLGPLINTVNYMTDLQLIGEPVYGCPLRALMGNSEFLAAINRKGGWIDAELDRLAADAKLPAWQVELQFYGSERTTAANWDYAKELIARVLPDAKATDGESLAVPLTMAQIKNPVTPYPSNLRRNVTQGVPSLGIWYQPSRNISSPNDWSQTHFGVMSVVPRSAEGVFAAQRSFAQIAEEFGIDPGQHALRTPFNWFQYAFIMPGGTNLGGDNTPEGKLKRARILERIIESNGKNGFGDYRATPIMQDIVADQYSFNNHVLRRFNEAIKDAVDPNGILSPGRGGIWPKRFRSLRGGIKL